MTEVLIPLKRDELQGGRAKSYKSSSNDQGTKHSRKRKATDREKQVQAERHVPVVKGLFGSSMKLRAMPAAEYERLAR